VRRARLAADDRCLHRPAGAPSERELVWASELRVPLRGWLPRLADRSL